MVTGFLIVVVALAVTGILITIAGMLIDMPPPRKKALPAAVLLEAALTELVLERAARILDVPPCWRCGAPAGPAPYAGVGWQ